jgi:putative ABC transport system permease protein
MIIGAILKIAFDALRANKLRSGLTLLGVVIGVTSVMTIVSALEGMMGAIKSNLEVLGPSTFIVAKVGAAMSEKEFLEKIKRKAITMSVVPLIEKGCPNVSEVTPLLSTRARIKYGSQALRNCEVTGCKSNYADIITVDVAQGRFISAEEESNRRPVAYIGEDVRKTFFEGVDPLGKELTVGGKKYSVVGVAKASGAMFGESQDNFVLIPLSLYTIQFGTPRWGVELAAKASSVEKLQEAEDEVRAVLRAQRKVPFNAPDDFDILTADNILDAINSFTRIIRLVLIGVSSISLVVGGIVVMNIMMVSVTERTREIGIRKSLGATQKHILMQFMFESLLLTLGGGFLGTALGYALAKILVGMIEMQISPSMLAIMLGVSISTGVGLFFGIYPAMKASRLDPVKALSYE